jgi:hypothetical protein
MHIPKNFSIYLAIAIFSLALMARLIPGPRTIDDAYITFRYARNILAGNGFVYNPGEHVLGTTTPIYTILLVIIGALFGRNAAPFPETAWIMNAILDGMGCVLLYKVGLKLGNKWSAIGAALAWSVAPFSVTFAIGGLETSLYVLLILASIYFYMQENYILTSLSLALLLLTRPDALILIGLFSLYGFWRLVERRILGKHIQNINWILKGAITFSLPVLAWLVFAVIYFGNPLPHSIAAKTVAYRLPPNNALIRLLQHFATPFQGNLTFGVNWIAVGLVLFPFLYLVGARQTYKSNPRSLPILIYPWAYFLVFALANPLIFRWYLTPPLPIYLLIILIGLENIITQLSQRLTTSKLDGRFIEATTKALLVVIVPTTLLLHGWTLHPDHGLQRPAPLMAWYQLELRYKQAADYLSPEIDKAASVPLLAAGDVGVLGYYTDARILDTVGLNSPQSMIYYPLDPRYYVINYAIPPDLIVDMAPDFVVILEVYGREGLLKDPRFIRGYVLRKVIPTDIYGSQGMLIFQRIAAK